MSDQVDPITPPIADPQDVVDAALNIEPTTTPPLPAPELATVPEVPQTPPPTPDPIPTPTAIPEPESISVPMSEEMPLAFVTPPPTTTTTTTTSTTQPVDDAVEQPKKKGSGLKKAIGVIVGVFLLVVALGFGGLYTYVQFGGGEKPTISIVEKVTKWIRVDDKVVRNPEWEKTPDDQKYNAADDDLDAKVPASQATKEECGGCQNGGWQEWRNGSCVITGICDSRVPGKDTENPMGDPVTNATDKTSCENSGKGQWCASVDSNGKSYAFCMKNDGSQGNCNNRAVELGYTVQIGKVGCQCISTGSTCTLWTIDDETLKSIQNANIPDSTEKSEIARASAQCQNQQGSFSATGKESYICKMGVKGVGGQVYSGGQCTELNGKKYTGKLDCFCGVVQVDTGTGHVSYSSQCGCDKTEKTTLDETTTPTMACTGLTRTPATAPSVGQAVTFSCAGSVTPSTAGTLSYKYRYSLNSGAYLPMTSNVLTIAACGSYSVQCQACATLNGVLTCDPTWTGATP